ncbi:MAG TPA: PIG-L family deacetylase [Pyrinomonadaceae bacterium]|nr:PIG-L family deacetylase [Pyrinomonadaceae bacterium]
MTTQPLKHPRSLPSLSAHARLFGSRESNSHTHCTVIAAHPGDEIVGAACLISRLTEVNVVHVTDGARDLQVATSAGFEDLISYAAARKQECLEALSLASVSEDRVVDFSLPDTSASERLPDLTKRIAHHLQESGAEIVVTHPYEGGHPDHDATAFATHAALQLLKQHGCKPPTLFEMALHPGDDEISKVTEFLPGAEGETTTLVLDRHAIELKRRMLELLKSQQQSIQASPLGYERFRLPPQYDFSAPPQEGKLHYENFDWAPRSDEWLVRARKAMSDLFATRQSNSGSIQNFL